MLTFGEMIDVVMRTLRLGEGHRPKVVARVQAMQKQQSFPPAERVGKGGRASYSAEQTFQLVYAFKLLDLGVPPTQATSFVLDEWERLRSATGHGLVHLQAFSGTGAFFLVRIGALNTLRAGWRGPFTTEPERGGVSLATGEAAKLLQEQPSYFDGKALLYVPWVAKEVFEAVINLISNDKANELLAAAKAWKEEI